MEEESLEKKIFHVKGYGKMDKELNGVKNRNKIIQQPKQQQNKIIKINNRALLSLKQVLKVLKLYKNNNYDSFIF